MFIPDISTVSSLCFNWEPENNIRARLAKGPTNDRELASTFPELSEVPKEAGSQRQEGVPIRLVKERFVDCCFFKGLNSESSGESTEGGSHVGRQEGQAL